MYSDIFSKVYDKFGWNYYPESFAGILQEWIMQEQLQVKNMLDIGCGTGILAHLMQEWGIQADGMDLSEHMIQVARENYPDMHFEVGDMVTYRAAKQYDLVTSTCDAINHILCEEDVMQVFKNVYSYMAPGGRFLFDLLQKEEAQPCEKVDLGEMDGEQIFYQILRENEHVTLQIDLLRGGTHCHTEKIHERLYDPEKIAMYLKEAGFRHVTGTDQLLQGHTQHAATWFMIAEK